MPSNHLILCRPLLLPPSIFPKINVFSNESVLCIRWPKYWSFSFSINPSNEYSGLVSLRMDWLDLLFFIVQLSHPYLTAGKTIALIRWTFVSKVMSLLFNMLSRLVITFLPRSKCLLISWLQSPYYFSKDLGYIYMESIIFAFFKLLRYNWCIALVGNVQH